MNYLTSKEKKKFASAVEKQWGACPKEIKEKILIKTTKDRIYLTNRDIEKADLTGIRVNSIGLYIAEEKTETRLSIEGAQLIGPTATKNITEINDEQRKKWFTGQDIDAKEELEGFVILNHGKDYIGSGKYKEGKIINFVPKTRRLKEVHL